MRQKSSAINNKYYRASRLLILLLCIAAMGPYVFPEQGLRLEHFVIYGSLPFVLYKLQTVKYKIDNNISLLVKLSAGVMVIILFVSLFKDNWRTIYAFFAGMENFSQPPVLILIIYSTTLRLDQIGCTRLIQFAGNAVILMLAFNTIVSISSIFYDITAFTGYFTNAGSQIDYEETVSALAKKMGRYSGIFNQPVECGLAYSTGLLVWAYLTIINNHVRLRYWVALSFLLLGGSLSVSKSFIYGGIPLFIIYWRWPAPNRLPIRKILIGCVSLVLIAVTYKSQLTESWDGLDFFLRVFDSDNYAQEGTIHLITGTRFGGEEDSFIINMAIKVLNEAPLFGFGVMDVMTFDNGYLEFFYSGGLIGIILHVALLAVILKFAMLGLRLEPELSRLLIALWTLIIATSIGAPTLTLNRSSIFLWLFIVLIFAALSKRRSAIISYTHPANENNIAASQKITDDIVMGSF